MIVIIDHDQVSELQMTRSRSSLTCDALHGAAIAEEAVGVIVDDIEARLVVGSRGMSLGDS